MKRILIRLGLLALGLTILMGLANCFEAPMPGVCGFPGVRACRGAYDAPTCAAGANVDEHGICQACGGPGQACCQPIGPASCSTTGYRCDSPTSTSLICRLCGHAGEPACANNYCEPPAMFSNGRCITGGTMDMPVAPDPGSGGCPAGLVRYSFGVRHATNQCAIAGGEGATICARSTDEARTEIARRFQSMPEYRDAEVVDSTEVQGFDRWLFDERLCVCNYFFAPAFSAEEANHCAQYHCLNCTVRETACPPLGSRERTMLCRL
jgi:hypothetical protein